MGQEHINVGTPNGQNGDFVRDAWVKAQDNFSELYNQDRGVIDVNADWVGGLTFNVSANSFPVDSIWYSATPAALVLDTADGAFDRIDLLVANINGTVEKITGELSGTNPAQPDYNYATQFPIKFVVVQAGVSIPSEFEDKLVFDQDAGEPSEWVFVPQTGVAVSTNNSYVGTISIEGTSTVANRATFTNTVPVVSATINLFSFWIKQKVVYGTDGKIEVYFSQKPTAGKIPAPISSVLVRHGQYGYDGTTDAWQKIIIDMSRLDLLASTIDYIQIKPYKDSILLEETESLGWFIDVVKLQVQTSIIPSEPSAPQNTSSFTNDGAGDIDGGGNTLKYLTPADVPTPITKTSEILNDGADNTSAFVEQDELGTAATSNDYNDLSNLPALGAAATSNDYNDLSNLPSLGAAATSNDYDDLSNLPDINNDLSKIWTFDTAVTGTNPGVGKLKFNSATPASVTEINVSNDTKQGIDVSAYLLSLQKDDVVYIQQANDATKYILVTLTSVIVDLTGYWRMPVSVNESGVAIDNGVDVITTIYKGGSPEVVANVQSIKELKLTLTPAIMLDLVANPAAILPAAGVGIVQKLLTVSGFVDFNSIAYDVPADLEIQYETSGVVINVIVFADLNSAVAQPFDIDKSAASGGPLSDNEAVIMTATGANATVGDSDIKLVILYAEQDFNF
jgi:hypothetical protein